MFSSSTYVQSKSFNQWFLAETGIVPYNPHAFQDTDFVAANVSKILADVSTNFENYSRNKHSLFKATPKTCHPLPKLQNRKQAQTKNLAYEMFSSTSNKIMYLYRPHKKFFAAIPLEESLTHRFSK